MEKQIEINGIKYISESELNHEIESSKLCQNYVGRYVICCSRNEEVNFGKLKSTDETGCILEHCRRLWYHKPANNSSWYEGVSVYGLDKSSKISLPVEEKIIIEDYSLIICSDVSVDNILKYKSHEN